MSEQVQEPEAPPEEAPPEDGEPTPPTEVDMPEGWVLVQDQPEETILLSETQGRSQVNPAILRAEKQINGSLVNAQGSTPEELQAATQAIEESVQAFKADPEAAPLDEAPTTATVASINPETGIVEESEIEVNPNTVITNEGSFTEEEWSMRSRTDTIVTDEGQVIYAGAGDHTEEIAQALDAIAADAADAENEIQAAKQPKGDTKQLVYSTAEAVDSPGQSSGGTVVVPKQVDTMAEASEAMAEHAQEVENQRVLDSEPLAEEAGGKEGSAEGAAEATPAAQEAAADLGVDLATVEGTGTGGKITKSDVEAAAGGGD